MKERVQREMAKADREAKPAEANRTDDLRLPDPNKSLVQQTPEILLAICLFGEARGEDDATRRAVAQVVLNRAWHPHRVFGSRADAGLEENLRRVILKPRQFSCFNPEDPNYVKLLRPLDYEAPAVWGACLRCAEQALAEASQPDTITDNSDHYLDNSLQPPPWANPAKQTARIGRLHFYRLYLPPLPAAASAGRESGRGVVGERQGRSAIEATPFQSPSRTLLAAVPAPRRAAAEACPPMSLPAPSHPTSRRDGLPQCGWNLRSGRLSSPSTWLFSASLRTGRASGVGLVLLLGVVMSGCSDFERTAYRTLAVTQVEYETVQQYAAEAYLHGLITEEQWERFRVAGHRFIEAHNAAVDALQLWSQTKSKSDTARLEAMLEVLPRLVREINSLLESFEEKGSEVRSQKLEGSADPSTRFARSG
ncbi:MAG: cell wall hydrolase [Acidobacteria bacterium]|nr:cell wall hydrolase [Acidobacteriota bacterium]